MVKMVRLLKRPKTMTLDEARQWWLGPHVEIAKKLPGLRKYVVSLVVGSPDPGEPKYDGMAEMWFDSIEDANRAQASDVMKEAIKDSVGTNFTVVRLTTEEHVIL
jgi:uncharacterized protein (TIGR02118 family)